MPSKLVLAEGTVALGHTHTHTHVHAHCSLSFTHRKNKLEIQSDLGKAAQGTADETLPPWVFLFHGKLKVSCPTGSV